MMSECKITEFMWVLGIPLGIIFWSLAIGGGLALIRFVWGIFRGEFRA